MEVRQVEVHRVEIHRVVSPVALNRVMLALLPYQWIFWAALFAYWIIDVLSE